MISSDSQEVRQVKVRGGTWLVSGYFTFLAPDSPGSGLDRFRVAFSSTLAQPLHCSSFFLLHPPRLPRLHSHFSLNTRNRPSGISKLLVSFPRLRETALRRLDCACRTAARQQKLSHLRKGGFALILQQHNAIDNATTIIQLPTLSLSPIWRLTPRSTH